MAIVSSALQAEVVHHPTRKAAELHAIKRMKPGEEEEPQVRLYIKELRKDVKLELGNVVEGLNAGELPVHQLPEGQLVVVVEPSLKILLVATFPGWSVQHNS